MSENLGFKIENIVSKEFGISPKLIKMSEMVSKEIVPLLEEIERIVEFNQIKVLSAMKRSYLSDYHLTGSTGYGYSDIGRDTIDQIYADVFKAEDALVRPHIVSGTHAITLCIQGVLRPGDELLSATGAPYDTLKKVLLGNHYGSLKDFGITYREASLKNQKPDYDAIRENINEKTRMVLIQRSRGYSLRPSLSIDEIEHLIKFIKSIKHDIICFVDNCYGEFVEAREPIEVGADLCAGSLIKNPGGGLAPTGGYVVGKRDLVRQCAYRLTAPGLDKSIGSALFSNHLIAQGLFYSPKVVGEALKGAVYTSRMMEKLGFEVSPRFDEKRCDIVTAAILGEEDALISFCRGIQKAGPVDSHVQPEPSAMPGYEHKVIMAGGSFIQGSSIELSADGPLREPYAVYVQGGLNFAHVKIGIMSGLQALMDSGKLTL